MPHWEVKVTFDASEEYAAIIEKLLKTAFDKPQYKALAPLTLVRMHEPSTTVIYDIYLDVTGNKKINVIKEVRALNYMGLKEAKDLVDGIANKGSTLLREGLTETELKSAVSHFEAAGATVSWKRSILSVTQEEIEEAIEKSIEFVKGT